MIDETVEQAIRVSHCGHDDKDKRTHKCVGSCKITPIGILLECTLCGDASNSLKDSTEFRKVTAILACMGISTENLDSYTIRDMMAELKKP